MSNPVIKDIFKERFTQMLGSQEEYQKFEKCILTPQRKSFRINNIKVDNKEEIVETLKGKGLLLEQVQWDEYSYFANYSEESRSDLGNLFEHFLGEIYVQEATSLLPPLALKNELEKLSKNNESFSVLDMCAAPGSKTTQIGSFMNNKGSLVANEMDYKRLAALKLNLERSGLTNVVITHSDGRRIEGEELFDAIILDAPCSGSGVIRKSPGTLKAYNPKKLQSLHSLQLQLLKRAFELLKTGCCLTYSTCSLDPEEDEFLLSKFLHDENRASLVKVEIPGIQTTSLKEFNGKEISQEIVENSLRVWPHTYDTNGFFLAKIVKNP